MCSRRCTLQVIPPTYRSPAGILMASLGPCEKQREAFKLQANTLLRTAPRPPLARRSHFALRTFLRAILILTRTAARHSSAPRCRRCTLIFQKNAHCASSPPSAPTQLCFLALFPPSAFCAHLRKSRKKRRKKREKAEGIPRAYTVSWHSRELSTLASPSPFVPDTVASDFFSEIHDCIYHAGLQIHLRRRLLSLKSFWMSRYFIFSLPHFAIRITALNNSSFFFNLLFHIKYKNITHVTIWIILFK